MVKWKCFKNIDNQEVKKLYIKYNEMYFMRLVRKEMQIIVLVAIIDTLTNKYTDDNYYEVGRIMKWMQLQNVGDSNGSILTVLFYIE